MSNINVNPIEPKKTGSFFQDNQKSITFIVGGIVVLILLYLGYQKLYLEPRAEKAANQLYKAEEYVMIDSLQAKAISGDGSFLGFKEIADEYSNTKSANIANAYLGGLYLRQGNYQEAIKYLQKYSNTGSEILDPLVIGLIGDAYSESKDYKAAADQYKRAAEKAKNSYTTPLFLKKLGLVYEALEDFKNAEQTYQSIKTDYPESPEANLVDGLIARAKAKQ
ncbi:tetratricopeptide repeat protein [Sphingobacterium psychroaquaticum]|uniref:Tetratricopeptide repeat-containing protein n=1 Tax=Sphingobacterium psychroaquaticum TaxID=561061 RepID=A0A1X7K3F7_9SPHI|nr:tetratricopeptide repeat protein [Sphingobacterium psychroaquaticum]QBQ42604.1 tetratricopeptide repeat protein [Sphingobacterium psychroaquaticum]SMG35264.1 Tetratricopeptide repeat-containing protein [Sphingobacterium psychroaquaticum]